MLATSRVLYINNVRTTAAPAKPAQTSDDSIRSYACWAMLYAYLHRKHKEA